MSKKFIYATETEAFFMFMWNKWSKEECMKIFGTWLGEHFWNKWLEKYDKYGPSGAIAPFYAELSSDNRKKLSDYAMFAYTE